jgi:WD40-like Beta Propeller Repeat
MWARPSTHRSGLPPNSRTGVPSKRSGLCASVRGLTGPRRLVRIGDVRRFFIDRVAWSPNGRWLAFTGESGLGFRQMDIWTVTAAVEIPTG